jgi:CheY-like chemotaxis protein
MNPVRDTAPARDARALVVDADPALAGLIEEWLEGRGCRVVAADEEASAPRGPYDLIVIDVPFPRQSVEQLKRIAERHPGTPILALSSSFFAGAGSALARALGVARVLPKPLTQEALIGAVDTLLDPA